MSDFRMNPYGNLSQFAAFADRIFLAMEQKEPRKGCLLVSAPDMRDDVFSRTIIYLIQHNWEGTAGIILNQQSEVAVHSVMPLIAPYCCAPASFYIGGPVEQERVVGLLRLVPDSGAGGGDIIRLVEGRTFMMAPTTMGVYLANPFLESYRLYMGYCSWETGQLEKEIADGDWYVCDAQDEDFAHDHHTDLYAQVLLRQPWPLNLYATRPVDPRLN